MLSLTMTRRMPTRCRRRARCLSTASLLLASWFGPTVHAAAAPPKQEQSEVRPTTRPVAVLQALRQSGGDLVPAVRAAYVTWAKGQVLGALSSANAVVPPDVLREADSDNEFADAMFASVSPPDPSVLQKYVELRSKLGPEFTKRYRPLVIAAAVAHRNMGVVAADVLDGDAPPDAEDLEADEPPVDVAAPPKPGRPDPVASAIAEFMKSTDRKAIDIYEQKDVQQQLFQYLKTHDVPSESISRLEKPRRLGEALKSAMVLLGQRPATRQAPPELATWLKHLAKVYESTPQIPKDDGKDPDRWPLFPMARAPWPLLMPLSRPLPLDEAKYIYEKFLGQHGSDRYHTYGPYRKYDAQVRAELQPSPWHWGAWPDRIVHGGVCVVMSGIAIDTHRALCEPAVPAGQPHHSNLISYHVEDGKWSAHVDQAFAGGPPVTHALWLFKDVRDGPARLVKKSHAGAEYHLGLGAALNVGLRSYIDSRIAVHLYRSLPDEDKRTLGGKLLTSATRLNPFNPEPWFLLAGQTATAADGLALARTVVGRAPGADLSRVGKGQGKGKRGKSEKQSRAATAQREYWETVAKSVIRVGVERHGPPVDPAEAKQIEDFLRQVGLRPDK